MMVFHHSKGLFLPVMIESLSASMPNCLTPKRDPVRERCCDVGTTRPLLKVTRRVGVTFRPSRAPPADFSFRRRNQHRERATAMAKIKIEPTTMRTIDTQSGHLVLPRAVIKRDDRGQMQAAASRRSATT